MTENNRAHTYDGRPAGRGPGTVDPGRGAAPAPPPPHEQRSEVMQRPDEMLKRYELLCDQVSNEEALSAMEKMRGGFYRTKSIRSGTLLEIEAYPLLPKGMKTSIRKLQVSEEAIKRHNQIAAEKRLVRLIEANFTEADYYFTGTFEDAKLPTLEQVRKIIKRFIQRVNYARARRGLENAKYIYVIEGYEEGSRQQRIHFHMVIDGALDRKELKEIWGNGRTRCDELDPRGYNGLVRLAKYLAKDPKGRKRWSPSKGLKQPVVTVADRKIRASAAKRIARNASEAAAALERIYPGYEHVETEVRTNPYIPGCYIYAVMRKIEGGEKKTKGGRQGEQGNRNRPHGSGAGIQADAKRSSGGDIPHGGTAQVQKRGRKV